MNILLLSKEFHDGEAVSEYTKNIAEYLVDQDHEATIISFDDGSYYSVSDEVEVERFPLHFEGDNLYNWSMMMNNEMKGRVTELMEDEEFDLIHANDWTTVPGGVALSKYNELPLVLTLHSTENERGFGGEESGVISELEWQGVYEAHKVLVNKGETRNSALFDLDAPENKLEMIDPLGEKWQKTVLNNYRKLLDNKREVKN